MEDTYKKLKQEFERCECDKYYDVMDPVEFMMPMEDGIRLKTIIYRPRIVECVPTITMRSSYPFADGEYRTNAQEYAKRGFAFIYQYCRGTGDSEGEWIPNENERKDGKTFLEWVNSQEWVKNIGYMGCSYLALTGWTVADIVPEKMKTMYLSHYGTSRYTSAYGGGLFRHDILTGWTMGNAGFQIDADYEESCMYMPHNSVDEDLWGKRIDWYREWIHNTRAEDEYWHKGFWGMLKEIPLKVDIPICMVEGWYDHHLASAIETYQALPEKTKKKSRFVIGAWEHGYQIKLEGKKGNDYRNNDTERAFRWFYSILAKEKEPEGGVDYYVIGEDKWYSDSEFFSKKSEKKVFLSGGKNAIGELRFSESQEKGKVSYLYNPKNPVKTQGAESCLVSWKLQGSLLQRQIGIREDVIHFVSDKLDSELEINGRIKVCLTVSSDADDTAFVAKICEENEDGQAYNIRTCVTTLSNMLSGKKYIPGEIVKIEMEAWDVAWKLSKGSRIRLDITSSDFPQYAVHSNYFGNWDEQAESKIAKQTIYYGGENESCIIFPTNK